MSAPFRRRLTGIIFAVLLLGVGFAAGQYYLQRTYQTQVEAAYRRALSELATHFQELAAELGRARLAVSGRQRSLIGANLRRLVYAAQDNLGELPLGEVNLEGLCRLLDEVHEQTYLYVQAEWDPQALEELYSQVQYVSGELGNLVLAKQQEYPLVSWQRYLAAAVAAPEVLQAFTAINDGLGELRSPLSRAPARRGEIAGESIGPEQAVKAAQEFCGRAGLHFQVTNESKGEIPAYTVEAKDERGRIIVEVSQKGGRVLWMMAAEEVPASSLSAQEMVDKGREFLEQRGFPPLHLTDVQMLRNRATLTFVPNRGGILRYAESVKVQVSAADGSILGFWGTPYYTAQSRLEQLEELPEQTWEVQDKLRSGLEVLDEKLALIPTADNREVLTKRVGVRYQDEYYLIYLNAATGEEEQIVQVSSPLYF
ncbi:MAG: hypothetical protein GX199_08555 [Firmicutes bacterium]|nr:hypothetical protein [Bacillota bacterium]